MEQQPESADRAERDAQYRAEARAILARVVGYEYWKTGPTPSAPQKPDPGATPGAGPGH